MKYLNKYVVSAVCVALFASLASASAFKTERHEKLDNGWVHYSNLNNGKNLIDLYVNGTGFRISGCGKDAYGHMKSKSISIREYDVESNLNKPLSMCDSVIKSMSFSASKVTLDVNSLANGIGSKEILQEIES